MGRWWRRGLSFSLLGSPNLQLALVFVAGAEKCEGGQVIGGGFRAMAGWGPLTQFLVWTVGCGLWVVGSWGRLDLL